MRLCRKPFTAVSIMAAAFSALLVQGGAKAAAPAFIVPPVSSPASQEHHPGKLIFVQLVTPDLAGAKRFYAGLLGWGFQDIPGTRQPYAVATFGGQAVAGLVQREMPPGGRMRPAWLGYSSAADIDAAIKTTVAQGGRVLAPSHSIPGRGQEAVLADPQGAVFGVLSSSSGDPADVLKPPGLWIWRSLITSDPSAGAGFYHALFGFESMALPSSPGEMHLLLASENYARATVNSYPVSLPDEHPHWLNFVRVADATKSASVAVTLGGSVLVPPRPDRHGGMIAVVADPQGAAIGLFEWAETETKEIVK